MAAHAALVSLLNDLELIPNHPTHSFSFEEKQISSLSQAVEFLIDFIASYDSHGCTREAAEVLESRIASSAHAAHDVIESHIVDQILVGGKARSYFLLDLQRAIENMEYVKRKAMQFKQKSGLKTEQPTYSIPPSTSSEPLKNNVMVGFDAVALRLMELLTREPSSQRLVIPIVGMGGIGKTTLAKYAYEHPLIKQYFDVCLWTTISQENNIETILTQLPIRETKAETNGNFNGLGVEMHKTLWGRRYLIVLDDVWSLEAWNEMHMFLPDNGNGSRVIVTTRLSNLAAHLSSSPFEMNFLDDEKSFELFCGNAFGEEDCPVELEKVGKKIVKRCRGLPLSIVVIGGHLRRSSRATEYWEKVANYMNPISSLGEEDHCLNIIRLSYEYLPSYLKPCFLYIAIYPEDEWIHSSELLHFLIAEGFIRKNESRSLEEVVEGYMKELIDRNLILVHQRRWNGEVEYYGIHDTVRELCLTVAKSEKFMRVLNESTEGTDKERRVVVLKGKQNNSDMIGALESAPLLSSLIRQRGHFKFDQLWGDLRLLRVLAKANNNFLDREDTTFPTASFQQVNLRYLAFSCQEPSTINGFTQSPYLPSLWNMQTLIINSVSVVFIAPYEIWQMSQLRHLELVGVSLPDPLPDDRSNEKDCIVLQNLHTLTGVMNLRLTDEVCIRMPNIKSLSLRYNRFPSDDWEASSYYCLHNLTRFKKLESLTCFLVYGDSKWRDIAASMRFPSSVEELCLWNCHLDWEDLTAMIKPLPRLGSLLLSLVRGAEWDLGEEEFPHLKVVMIFQCEDLICWNASSAHFPVLEILNIGGAPKLSEIPFGIGEIPTLTRIRMDDCSVSAAISGMRMVVEQESFGNELLFDVNFWRLEKVMRFQKMAREEGLTSNNLRLCYRRNKTKAFYDNFHFSAPLYR